MKRLVDAEKVCDILIDNIDWLRNQDYDLYCLIGDKIHFAIDQTSTAYDIDKVVEQLNKDDSIKLYGSANSENYLLPVKRAIDIVRNGGCND